MQPFDKADHGETETKPGEEEGASGCKRRYGGGCGRMTSMRAKCT